MTDDEPPRSAFVTGAARGIGRAVAQRLAADGLAVSVADLPVARDDLQALATSLDGAAHPLDVADAPAVDAAVDAHVARFGGVDVMVANAGVAVTAPLLETTDEQWRQTFAVNVLGVVHCYRAAARAMIAGGRGGRLIAAASVSMRGLPLGTGPAGPAARPGTPATTRRRRRRRRMGRVWHGGGTRRNACLRRPVPL